MNKTTNPYSPYLQNLQNPFFDSFVGSVGSTLRLFPVFYFIQKGGDMDWLALLKQHEKPRKDAAQTLAFLSIPAATDTGLESMGLGVVPIAAPEPLPKPPAEPPAPDWQALHHAYMVHAMQCPQCKAAGKGERYGQRCIAGLELWQAYDATPYPYTHQKPRPDYNLPHGGKTND